MYQGTLTNSFMMPFLVTHQFKDISVILSKWYHISWNWADCDTYLATSSWGSMPYTIIMSRASACSQPAFRNLSFCTHAADLLWDDSRTSGCLFIHKLNTWLPECPENSRPPHLPRSTGDAAGSRSSPGQIDRSCSPGCTCWVTAAKESQHETFRNHGWWKLQIGERQGFYKHTHFWTYQSYFCTTLSTCGRGGHILVNGQKPFQVFVKRISLTQKAGAHFSWIDQIMGEDDHQCETHTNQ